MGIFRKKPTFKNEITKYGDIIKINHINDDEALNFKAKVSYNEEMFEFISGLSFEMVNSVVYCKKLKKSLEEIVVDFYYTKAVRKKLCGESFTVTHINGKNLDCTTKNLVFSYVRPDVNKKVAGDIWLEAILPTSKFEVSKNIDNDKFETFLEFCVPTMYKNSGDSGEEFPLMRLSLNYGDDFKTVLSDVRNIVDNLLVGGRLNVSTLRCTDIVSTRARKRVIRDSSINFEMKNGKVIIPDDHKDIKIVVTPPEYEIAKA